MSESRGDWQVKLKSVDERSSRLFETGQWSDCKFIVGQEPHQQNFNAHKLILAMSSPVFEAMFYGSIAEKNDPIPIKDVQPKAFKALLQYIYTNEVNLTSFDLACELCYSAKKYMFPFLVQHCTRYMWSDLCPKNVCRAYEFSHLFEEFELRDQCLSIIQKQTKQVLRDPSFCEIERGTLLAILDQNNLNIDSELELYQALESWCKAECTRKQLNPNDPKCLRTVVGDALHKIRFLTLSPKEFADGPAQSSLLTQEESFAILMNISSSTNTVRMPKDFETTKMMRNVSFVESSSSSELVPNSGHMKDIRCYMDNHITMNMQELQDSLGTKDFKKMFDELRAMEREKNTEAVANNERLIESSHLPSFCREVKYYCSRTVYAKRDVSNYKNLDSSLSFVADKNICIVGIVVPTQKSSISANPDDMYTEVVYAYLLDPYGIRLTYTYFTSKVKTGCLMEISFNRAIIIQKHKVYRVEVVFNKVGTYPGGTCANVAHCNNVYFLFNVRTVKEDVRDGLIRSIVFV